MTFSGRVCLPDFHRFPEDPPAQRAKGVVNLLSASGRGGHTYRQALGCRPAGGGGGAEKGGRRKAPYRLDMAGGGSKRQRVLQDDVFFLYEGGEIAEERRRELTRVRIGAQVKDIPPRTFQGCTNLTAVQFEEGALHSIGESAFHSCKALPQVTIPSSVTTLGEWAFFDCINLARVQLNEGLEVIGDSAFYGCNALQQVTIPSSVTKLDGCAFYECINLAHVQLNDGLQNIGNHAFNGCTALRSVTMPSSVTEMGNQVFYGCTNLTEVILLDGDILLNQGFLDRGLFSGQGVLNQKRLNEMMMGRTNAMYSFACYDCPLTAIKISIPRALSQRMARLPQECRLSVEGRIRDLRRLELTQDGNILACFPVVITASDDNFLDDTVDIQDTNNQTAESLHQVLRLISYHELKESSILIELAMWKLRLDEDLARADCRTSVPDTAKSSIIEYCGFAGFLEPVIEGG